MHALRFRRIFPNLLPRNWKLAVSRAPDHRLMIQSIIFGRHQGIWYSLPPRLQRNTSTQSMHMLWITKLWLNLVSFGGTSSLGWFCAINAIRYHDLLYLWFKLMKIIQQRLHFRRPTTLYLGTCIWWPYLKIRNPKVAQYKKYSILARRTYRLKMRHVNPS